MEISDQELIKEYLAGNELAFEKLLDRYLRSIYNFIHRICQNKEDAEDIVQDTFFKAWKNLKRYRIEESPDASPTDSRGGTAGASFKTWLFTIARNTATDLLRKRRNLIFTDLENEDDDNIADNIIDTALPPDKEFEIKERLKELDELLNTLSSSYKQILLLKHENDFTFEEIGRILNKPLNTVKSQHRRAMALLHQKQDAARIDKHDK